MPAQALHFLLAKGADRVLFDRGVVDRGDCWSATLEAAEQGQAAVEDGGGDFAG